ncbi:MAG: GAF domain-containing protein, partial [Candidatus Limnocylindrales bacterium]
MKARRSSAAEAASPSAPRRATKPVTTVAEAATVADPEGVAALRARIGQLEGAEERRADSARVDAALLKIAETAAAAHDMGEFYAAIYEIVGGLVYATNCYIALYDESRNAINFPFFVDEVDPEIPDPAAWHDIGRGDGAGATGWLLRTGEPRLLTGHEMQAMAKAGELEAVGTVAKTWVGAPLRSEGRTIGLIAVQSYRTDRLHTDRDLEVLTFVANHIASALARTRAIDETRQRNAELALVNEVGLALAEELDLTAIIEVVGERIRGIFGVDSLLVGLVDEGAGLMRFPYVIDGGERNRDLDEVPLGSGLTSYVVETHRPLRLGRASDPTPVESIVRGLVPESWLGVPIPGRDRVIGVVALESQRQHAFSDADERLLSTLAASMGVALENARLFDETKRLLEETDQRAAQLAVVNEIGQALAGQLDFDAIIDLVGGRLASVLASQDMYIALYDRDSNMIRFPFELDHGRRVHGEPIQLGQGLTSAIIASRSPLRFGTIAEQNAHGALPGTYAEGESGSVGESWLGVPIMSGEHVSGVVVFGQDAPNAFSEADERLVTTVASSMGVALENARLFDETKRLLAETDQRNAELAIITSVQDGLAAKLDMQAMYELVGDKIQKIFNAQVVDIAMYDRASGLLSFPYSIERGVRFSDEPIPLVGFRKHVIETRRPLLIDHDAEAERVAYGNPLLGSGEMPKSNLLVPLIVGDEATGTISLQNYDSEYAFSESEVRLLTTIASSLSVALENARLFDQTKRLLTEADERAAELAVVNGVQEGLSANLDMQAMYELVGDKIQEVFDAQVVDIATYDVEAGTLSYQYTIEKGVRFPNATRPVGGFGEIVMDTHQVLLVNDVDAWERERGVRNPAIQGEDTKSVLFAPLVSGREIRGRISLQNVDRTNAFSDSDVRLLTTLAGSLSVALENARLFDETKRLLAETDQRAAELAIITGVQDGLAANLDMQAMYDLVGDKIHEIFDAQEVDIGIFDHAAGIVSYPYIIERGVRLPEATSPIRGFGKHVLETRQVLLVDDVEMWEADHGGPVAVVQGEPARSVLFAPLISGGEVRGRISLQNMDRTNAFSESDVRLLTTIAGSLSVALENARLFDETRRLLAETNERAAELAVVNSVQEGLSANLDMQAMYELVGDKIHEIFDAQAVDIATFDTEAGTVNYQYGIEKGVRFPNSVTTIAGFGKIVLETHQVLLVNDVQAWERETGAQPAIAQGEPARAVLFAPLISGGEVRGRISLQNIDRTNAFSDSNVRLLTTLASSLSVALENARLFDETRRLLAETDERAAELAVVNSVQEGLSANLDMQAMYELVGDKIHEIFDAQVVDIGIFDLETGIASYPYTIERGVRFPDEPGPITGFSARILETRQVILINDVEAWHAETGEPVQVIQGEPARSVLFAPLIVSGQVRGRISLQNLDHVNAFSESDVRLLTTLVSSLSVALENARLFDETKRLLAETDQRAAELAIITSVQDGLAAELDMGAMYDLVGDKVREIFDAQVVDIATVDRASGLVHFPYLIERGIRIPEVPIPLVGFRKHVIETRRPLLIDHDVPNAALEYGNPLVLAGEAPKSALFVPLIVGDEARGIISLQNLDAEYAFDESAVRLLTTLAGSLSVALENARLFDETKRLLAETDQRAAELAIINGVQEGLAAELDMQAMYELVGERIGTIFDAQVVDIATFELESGTVTYSYDVERGVRFPNITDDIQGFSKELLRL